MRALLTGLVAVLLVALTGCVRLPESGPVLEGVRDADPSSAPGAFYVPSGPQPGESATDIVRHFMEAMTATPLQTGIAREFLTGEAGAEWEPERATLTYAGPLRPAPRVVVGSTRVRVRLPEANRLDRRGAWLGELGQSASTLDFPMAREDGEWRIATPPDALIVPESWFEDRFRQVSLYFFDPTARILVPEPVFVPNGDQLATTLVRRLVEGPGRDLAGVSRTFFPRQASLELSVTVSGAGVAEVDLGGELDAVDFDTAGPFLAQLAWTLRQDPSIEAFRLTLAGEPLVLPDGSSEVPVGYGVQYAPDVSTSSNRIFGLDEGLLVDVVPGEGTTPVRGPFGLQRYGLRDIAVDMPGERVAGVTTDGAEILLGAVDDAASDVRPVIDGGEDLAKPSWDHAGRLWTLDRTTAGARVVVVVAGELTEVTVPGVTGRDVSRLKISRDGSRLVAALRGPRGDRVVVNRVRYDEEGAVDSLSGPTTILTGEEEPLRVIDLAWDSPTSLVVAEQISRGIWTSYVVPVDGSRVSTADLGSRSYDFEPVRRVVAAPEPDLPTYLVTESGASALGSPGNRDDVAPGVGGLTYVG